MDAAPMRVYIRAMADISLTTTELRDAAMACRVASCQAAHDADRQQNPKIKTIFEDDSHRYLTLAEKFDLTRLKR